MVTVTASVKPELATFDDYMKFGTDEERPKGATTREAYCWTLDLFLRFLDNREPTTENAKEWLRSLEEKGNSPSTINRHIWALKSFFSFRKSSGIPGAEELKIRGVTTEEHYPRYLKDKEWDHLLQTATAPIYDPMVSDFARRRAKLELALLMCYCGGGLRCREATNLKPEDVIDEGFLHVTRKGRREDFVPVEGEVIRIIKEYLVVKGMNGHYIFSGKDTESPMAERTAQVIIKKLCVRAGLMDVHVHSLRHTAGYQLRKAGAPERDIQDFLGHKNIQTTRIYSHLAADELRKRLPKRFGKPKQGRMELT
ncbi:MAG: tyrosine-type recombinase/integrase [Desulfobacterales bacterium]|nr:tyrosine-type recombinase/integrase [Desulfobacterales bacterium]